MVAAIAGGRAGETRHPTPDGRADPDDSIDAGEGAARRRALGGAGERKSARPRCRADAVRGRARRRPAPRAPARAALPRPKAWLIDAVPCCP